MRKRVEKIFSHISNQIDAILLINSSDPFVDTNFFYVTGLTKGLFENCACLLYPDGKIDLIVSELEKSSASKLNAEVLSYRNNEEFKDILERILSSVSKLGLNYEGISHNVFSKIKKDFPNVKYEDISKSLIQARMIKDETEIDIIKKACEIADKVALKIPEFLHEGFKEYELAAEIDYNLQKNGADKPAFETISSFSINSAEPHYTHADRELKNNDFVLCDFGASYRKYNSDITRTFIFGEASDKQKEMYEVVKKAQEIGLQSISAGAKAHEVHDVVSSFIDNTKFKGCFIHSTGHSLGMNVHDGGVGFAPNNDVILKEGMVLTVEPGVYIPGYGGVRIEDDIIVRKNKAELLTKTNRNLIEI